MGPHKRVPRSAPRAAWGVISARVEGRGQRRGGSPFRPSRSPASSRAWPTQQEEGVENYSANITCTYIPRRVLVCTSLGGADDLELPSFPFRPTNHRRSLPSLFFCILGERVSREEEDIGIRVGIWEGFFFFGQKWSAINEADLGDHFWWLRFSSKGVIDAFWSASKAEVEV